MNGHKIEREAVRWAWHHLYRSEPTEETIEACIAAVLRGEDKLDHIRIAIAYVESAKNHVDLVLELETNLESATEELASLRTAAAYYRIADYNQRRCANTGTAECYRRAAEAMDRALGASPAPRGDGSAL